ncbi:MAG: NAD(P)-binding domain-containing protein [Deltaproteobacteria bacterium]|nr:NAD(P)-binding domain-containing protein [Deltaproteobacteria bacterium]
MNVVVLMILAAAVPYAAWSYWDKKRQARNAMRHEEAQQLGDDIFPITLHPEIDLDKCIGSGACIRACPEKDILAITDGRARLINPLACVGHSACMSACPVGAIKLIYGTATRGVELPKLSPHYETSQRGIYVVGELSGMGLIRNCVEQGRQAATAIVKEGRRGGDYDAIVVGSGPSGTAAALQLEAYNIRTLVVDQTAWGGTIAHYPRAKVVMTGSFELPGYGTVRKRTMSKEQLLELWRDIRARTQLHIEEGVRVEAIHAEGNVWRVVGTNGWVKRAANVVLALGRRGAPNTLGVPGEELPMVAYRVLEPQVYRDKHVLVVGGGNAAADNAIALVEQGHCASVSLSYRRTELGRLRGLVRNKIDKMFRSGQITPYLGTEVAEIHRDRVILRGARGTETVPCDAVIIQIGGRAPSELLRTIGIELVEKRGAA